MGRYVDGFVIPVPAGNLEKYRTLAQAAGEIWKEHGALEYVEAVGDDLEIDKSVSFRKIAGTEEAETVIFAFIVYESREERDRINALVMADSRIKDAMCGDEPPFDYRRMAYGGFRTLVDL